MPEIILTKPFDVLMRQRGYTPRMFSSDRLNNIRRMLKGDVIKTLAEDAGISSAMMTMQIKIIVYALRWIYQQNGTSDVDLHPRLTTLSELRKNKTYWLNLLDRFEIDLNAAFPLRK